MLGMCSYHTERSKEGCLRSSSWRRSATLVIGITALLAPVVMRIEDRTADAVMVEMQNRK